jgi:molybdate transport system ATP-binding protein
MAVALSLVLLASPLRADRPVGQHARECRMSLEFDVRTRIGPFEYEAEFTARDEIVVITGHSGAGKSVTLQFIAGLMRPAEGRIVIDGQPVFDSAGKVDLPPQARHTGYVVQDLALFPDDGSRNVARHAEGADRQARVKQPLGLQHRRPRGPAAGDAQWRAAPASPRPRASAAKAASPAR